MYPSSSPTYSLLPSIRPMPTSGAYSSPGAKGTGRREPSLWVASCQLPAPSTLSPEAPPFQQRSSTTYGLPGAKDTGCNEPSLRFFILPTPCAGDSHVHRARGSGLFSSGVIDDVWLARRGDFDEPSLCILSLCPPPCAIYTLVLYTNSSTFPTGVIGALCLLSSLALTSIDPILRSEAYGSPGANGIGCGEPS